MSEKAKERMKRNEKVKQRMRSRIKLLIWGIGFGLPVMFGWLKFKGLDFVGVASSIPADMLLKSAMALYFFCWCMGLSWDTDNQAKVYVEAPNKGQFSLDALLVISWLLLVFALLCVVPSFGWFTVLLLLFWASDCLGWRYIIVSKVKPTIRRSESHYKANGDYAKLEGLKAVDDHICGRWKWVRYCVGLVILALLGFTVFLPPFAQKLQELTGGLSKDFITAALVSCHVVAMETWIWVRRLALWSAFRLIENLDDQYTLTPKTRTAGHA